MAGGSDDTATGVTKYRPSRRQNQIHPLERVDWRRFKAEVERRAGITFEPIRPYEFTGRGDRIGWVKALMINGT